MLTRRELLKAIPGIGVASAFGAGGCVWQAQRTPADTVVNDIHSQLNRTRVRGVVRPNDIESMQKTIAEARARGQAISIAGGMHAMGGQQFGTGTILLDMRAMNRILNFDPDKGLIEVEAGIQWPELVGYLLERQKNQTRQWGIIQKQTGADRLCIGGALSANVHGRGVYLKPIIGDVESFTLVDANANVLRCSRKENYELFRLAIGGYGLFGVIASVTLRLGKRQKLERVVEVLDLDDLIPVFQQRLADGTLYGDFQYSTDANSPDFLRRGIFSRYRPIEDKTPIAESQKELSAQDWKKLVYLAHVDKKAAFDFYSRYYLSTSGQRYWSDTHQLSVYIDNYHDELDRQLGAKEKATEMITEIYFPRNALFPFLEDVRKDLRESKANVIFGTFRLIEKDDESFLAWAKEPYACLIFNLHTEHSQAALEKTAGDFRLLIDRAIEHGGSYYLTYHRWATRKQVEACYPQFAEFLRLKKKYDPEERFRSDWYRHHKSMFAEKL
ncbi:MAG TPA: FAD-binding oxidoreductase [Candidatus Acidoferrales bacterium]|nr:FAD-binding oxidoreductase [Candidatus Acidoferrales bacterium]